MPWSMRSTMKYGPFLAVVFAFFLIAIFPYYAGNDEPTLITTDSDGDGITDNKDECPREKPAPGQDLDEDGCIDSEISKEEIKYLDKISIPIVTDKEIKQVASISTNSS